MGLFSAYRPYCPLVKKSCVRPCKHSRQWRRQASEFWGGGHLRGKLIFGGGKIEFLRRYCYLPMPLLQDVSTPPPRSSTPSQKEGDIPRNIAHGRANILGISPTKGPNTLGTSPPFRIFAPHMRCGLFK